MKKHLKKINKILVITIKLNLREIFSSIIMFPKYLKERRKYFLLQGNEKWIINFYPIMSDRMANAAKLGDYFWQDFFVAKEIINQAPIRHIDVGSRIDGFITHIACVRKVEVFDIRPLAAKIDNVKFTQWDITSPNKSLNGIADCVSCLHTLEHIGLGRYGDKLDPEGWKKGLKSLVDLVASGGHLWLSVPIGIQRVEFNAHRVFDPRTIIKATESIEIRLEHFFYLTEKGFIESSNIEKDFEYLANKNYGLGIFHFSKE